MTDRENLMKNIQVCSFNLFDAALYLDTHKNDKDALKYYSKHQKMQQDLKDEYQQKYGPLVISENTSETTWKWSDGPWPWEYVK